MTSTTAQLLYMVFALGGAALYLLMPKTGRPQAMAGVILGVLSAVALLAVLAIRVVTPDSDGALFYIFAAVAVIAASRVITHSKPVYSALYFVVVVVAVAALLVLQQAEFLAIALIIIYAGAILVTYLFVIMLANQGGSPIYDRRSREPFLAILVGFVLTAAIAGKADGVSSIPAMNPGLRTAQVEDGNTIGIGAIVMTKYVVALEISGVLLLVSMVGAIAISRKKVPVEAFAEAPRPLGQVGREVEPF